MTPDRGASQSSSDEQETVPPTSPETSRIERFDYTGAMAGLQKQHGYPSDPRVQDQRRRLVRSDSSFTSRRHQLREGLDSTAPSGSDEEPLGLDQMRRRQAIFTAPTPQEVVKSQLSSLAERYWRSWFTSRGLDVIYRKLLYYL